jgi:flagellar secretion chaperone FliS
VFEEGLNNKLKNKQFVKNMVETASPFQLVALLYDGANQWMSMAKQELKKNSEVSLPDWTNYCHNLDMAIKILTHLQETLDHNQAPELADNLFALYDFIKSNLITAISKKSEKEIDDSIFVLKDIRESWKEGMKLLRV